MLTFHHRRAAYDEEFDSVDALQTDETPLVDSQIYLPVISQ